MENHNHNGIDSPKIRVESIIPTYRLTKTELIAYTDRPALEGEEFNVLVSFIATVSIASPGVVTYTSHGFVGGEAITFKTTGALPTGLVAGTTYYVKYVNADTFQLTPVPFGTAINTSGTQSGVHTLSLNRKYIRINKLWKYVNLS